MSDIGHAVGKSPIEAYASRGATPLGGVEKRCARDLGIKRASEDKPANP
jgi:hypothetical protein